MRNPNFEQIWLILVKMATIAAFTLANSAANATDSDPRAYSNIPVGMNFFVAGYGYTAGNVSFSPSVPIKNAEMTLHSAVLAYSRALDVFGMSGKVDIILPTASLSGTADVQGQPRSRSVEGFADPIARFYVNFYGAPALSSKDFAAYQQNLIIGGSLAVTAPGGQYDTDKLVNLGTNRWSFKPEIGVSRAWGSLTTELAAGVIVFTDNNEPFQGETLQQDPLYTVQAHLVYNFGPGIWGAFDTNYYTGGDTSTDGRAAGEPMENWRVGGTFSFPIHRHHSIKLYGSTGVYSRTGSDFDIIGIAWQCRWGEGF
ncbi:MAG: transporter [Methylococcaceae bacterium]